MKGLMERNFRHSKIELSCVILGDDCIVLCYADIFLIFTRKHRKVADVLVQFLCNYSENCTSKGVGSLDKYLGADVDRRKDSFIYLSQSHLTARFLVLVCINEYGYTKDTPNIEHMLHRDLNCPARRYAWNYRQAVGMLGYLQGYNRPYIACISVSGSVMIQCYLMTEQ